MSENTSNEPKVFFSYSSLDKSRVYPLAEQLRASGVDVWFAPWEMIPGDSLVDKINQGISKADAFLIAISHNSLASSWVNRELNAGIVRKISDQTRLLIVRVDDAIVPTIINDLYRVNLEPLEDAVRDLLKAIFRIYEKPPIGSPPAFIQRAQARQQQRLRGLSADASAVLTYVVKECVTQELPFYHRLSSEQITDAIGMDERDVRDALDELIDHSLLEPDHEGPYTFWVQLRSSAWLWVDSSALGFDLERAINVIAAVVANADQIDRETLEKECQLPIEALRVAIHVIDDQQIANVIGFGLGDKYYGFFSVYSTPKTRRWVREHQV